MKINSTNSSKISYKKLRQNYNYLKETKEGFPYRVYWRKVAGNRKLDVLEESDLIYDEYDLKIRGLL